MSTADAPGQALGPVGLCRVGGPGGGPEAPTELRPIRDF